jgi:FHS family L-fucose permease-like MFS transporter
MTVLVVSLFFIWGFTTVLNDSLIPKLKAVFTLGYAEVMLVQFAFFLSYLVFSLPAAGLLARIGYLRGIVVGLVVMAAGGLLFSPAADLGLFPLFLVALFVIGSGITMLQVAANPLMANLGDAKGASSRLTLAQAFNSLGTTIGPAVGARVILGGPPAPDPATTPPDMMAAFRHAEAQAVQLPFVGIAAVLAILAVIFLLVRNWPGAPAAETKASRSPFSVLRAHPLLALGALSIFVYVGCEVSIGSFMTNYLMQPSTIGYPAADAARLVSLYWGGAMVGRFLGSVMLRLFPPGRVLTCCALAASTLVVISSLSGGWLAAGTIIAVGLANAIMFPTIFALAIQGLGEDTSEGSGLLCMAIFGGAVIPPVTGWLADHVGIASALLLPAVLYLWIATYGVLARRRGEPEGVLSHV